MFGYIVLRHCLPRPTISYAAEVPAFKPSIRYLFVATTVIAISLAIYMQPLPVPAMPTLSVAGQQTPTPSAPTFNELVPIVLGSWPIRLAAFSLGISTAMHLVVSSLGLSGFLRGLVAIGAPTLGVIAWHLSSNQRAYFSAPEVAIFSLVVFGCGFALVSYVYSAAFASGIEQDGSGR